MAEGTPVLIHVSYSAPRGIEGAFELALQVSIDPTSGDPMFTYLEENCDNGIP